MIAIGLLFVRMLCDLFKPRPRLEAEILILRHQLNVLQQRTPRRRLHLRWVDRALFIWLYRRYPRILDAMSIVRPETVVRWHRKGFTGYWRWKSRSPGGRPRIAREVRELIRRMSFENSLWGATKIHGELLKLGIVVAQSTVSIYMVPRRDRPLQTWETFLRNHMEGIASIDLFVVPTIAFQQLFAFLVLGHKRRQLLWFAVTRNPTAEWLARQITEAFPWDSAPKYLIRDNDRAFGVALKGEPVSDPQFFDPRNQDLSVEFFHGAASCVARLVTCKPPICVRGACHHSAPPKARVDQGQSGTSQNRSRRWQAVGLSGQAPSIAPAIADTCAKEPVGAQFA